MNNHPMRRNRQQISNPEEIAAILDQAVEAHIGMAEGTLPYVVPMNFGWESCEDRFTVYLHCAGEGRKLPLLKSGNSICFQVSVSGNLRRAEEPCSWGISYQSVIAWGRPEELGDPDEKTAALNLIMKKYARREFSFPREEVARTRIFRIVLEELTAKRSS